MRSIVGLALLMIGVTIGVYAYYPETVDQHVRQANITRIIAPVGNTLHPATAQAALEPASQAAAETSIVRHFSPIARTFSPGGQLFANTRDERNAERTAAISTSSIAPARPSLVATGWSTVVTPAVPSKSGTEPLKSSLPTNGSARYALIRDIQKELKRVGCYWGKIDGDWGPGSKRAMQGFVRTVNATLPTNKPDYILLALARSQTAQVCGVTAPAPIIAHNTRTLDKKVAAKNSPRSARRAARVSPVSVPQPRLARVGQLPVARHQARHPDGPLPGRMAVGGPLPHRVKATHRAPGVRAVPATSRETFYDDVTEPEYARQRPAHTRRAIPQRRQNIIKQQKKRRVATRAAAKKARPRSRRYRRSKRRGHNPLRNILRQGVY